jgi:carbonic anhydrase/acetyltransferase-like protein (isoleucine patch superfamily)
MALIRELNGFTPGFGRDCFLAETAVVIGDVMTGDECSIWYNAVLRGDVNSIRLGNRVNIQDNVMLHCTYQKTRTVIGNNVSVAHNAIVHGCTIHDNVLVGMGAIVMDNCLLESYSIIAAGAVLTQNTHVREGEIWAGIPAQKIGVVSKELREGEIERIAMNYVKYSSWYKSSDNNQKIPF